jgi:Ca2+-binding RTX toxin-like protein
LVEYASPLQAEKLTVIFIQREGTSGTVTFEGEQARVLRADGSVFIDWTTGGALPDVPQGDGYTLEVMRGGHVSRDSLAIGVVVWALGQSNIGTWFVKPDFQSHPHRGIYDLDSVSYTSLGTAAYAFGEALSASLGGVPVGFMTGAVGGSPLLMTSESAVGHWIDEGPGSIYQNALDALNKIGGKAEVTVWIQGESDARTQSVTYQAYHDGLVDLVSRIQHDVDGTHIIISGTGNWEGTPEEYSQIIRDAQAGVASELAGVDYVPFDLFSDLVDAVHWSEISAAWQAIKLASAAAVAIGEHAQPTIDVGTGGDDDFNGGEDDDRYIGLEGNDVIAGNGGDDLLIGREGDDHIDGGDGVDLLSGGAGNDTVFGGADEDLIYGDAGDDVLYGDGGNDTLKGGFGDDTLVAGEGNDFLEGGEGVDVLVGGSGNDTYVISDTGDTVVETFDGGTDTIVAMIDIQIGENIENLIMGRSTATIGIGNDLDNKIEVQFYSDYFLYGGGGDDTITSSYGRDHLYGGDGNDILNGGMAADAMFGGAGDDTYYVDNVGDTATESADEGVDWVHSTVAFRLSDNVENITFAKGYVTSGVGNDQNNIMIGGLAAIKLDGRGGDDTLYGGTGSDTLDGGSGSDLMVGGKGNDTYIVDDLGDQVVEDAVGGTDIVWASVSYTLGANVENLVLLEGSSAGFGNELANILTGSSGNNELSGLAGNDTIRGGDGDDLIDGGTGIDSLYGDAGNDIIRGGADNDRLDGGLGIDRLEGGVGGDTYYVDNTKDQVLEAYGEGTDTVYSSAAFYALSANVENLTLLDAAVTGFGNELNNRISGNALNNTLHGMAGSDTINGGDGNDSIDGGDGADTLNGQTGDDYINGGAGADTFIESAGNDIYIFDNVGDKIAASPDAGGLDTISTSVSVDLSIQGEIESLRLTGSAAISGTGNALSNLITGNGAANIISGKAGTDNLYGKGGADIFAFNEMGASNKDSIWDFDADDRIKLGSAFAGLDVNRDGVLDAGAFAVATKFGALPPGDRAMIIYNSATGVVSYDADGSGSQAAQDIAFIGSNKTFFDASDVTVGSLPLV